MDVSKNRGTPKSSMLIGISIVNHPFWGTPIFGNTHMYIYDKFSKVVDFSSICGPKLFGWMLIFNLF